MDLRTRQIGRMLLGILIGVASTYLVLTADDDSTPVGPERVGETTPPPLDDESDVICVSRAPAHQLGFVDGELILTGTNTNISAALNALENSGQVSGRRTLVTYSDISLDPDSIPDFIRDNGYSDLGYQSSDFSDLVSELVTLRCDVSTLTAISRIDPAQIFVDVNSLISKSSVAANNPADTLNDPNDSIGPIGPDPTGGCCNVAAAQDAVSDQVDALNDRYSSTPPSISYSLTAGEGEVVSVEVFDNYPVPTGTTGSFSKDIGWAFPETLTLSVIPYVSQDIGNSSINRSDHGVFTAGIIHSIAPGSNITIHQVLDNQGEGTLATLLTALDNLVSGSSSLSDTIIHIGLHLTNNKTVNTQVNSKSLKSILSAADTKGATTVIATGNYHNPAGVSTPVAASDPASLASDPTFGSLIAVGAGKNNAGQLDVSNNACFAHTVPGGNSIREFGGFALCSSCTQEPKCRSQYIHHGCTSALYNGTLASVTCDDALVSLALSNEPTVDTSGEFETGGTGHGYWIGTSFSSALITGWIAANPTPSSP